MSDGPIYFAPLRVPLIDARTGLMSREWYLFFQALFLRIGGTSAPTNDDLAMGLTPTNVAPDLAALQTAIVDALNQGPALAPPITPDDPLLAELQQTRELVATLLNTVQDMRQGAFVI